MDCFESNKDNVLLKKKRAPIFESSFMLSCQVSNLNSSGPKPDVLPITPQDNPLDFLFESDAKVVQNNFQCNSFSYFFWKNIVRSITLFSRWLFDHWWDISDICFVGLLINFLQYKKGRISRDRVGFVSPPNKIWRHTIEWNNSFYSSFNSTTWSGLSPDTPEPNFWLKIGSKLL